MQRLNLVLFLLILTLVSTGSSEPFLNKSLQKRAYFKLLFDEMQAESDLPNEVEEDEDGNVFEIRYVFVGEEVVDYEQKMLKAQKLTGNIPHSIQIQKEALWIFQKLVFGPVEVEEEFDFEWQYSNGTPFRVNALKIRFESSKDLLVSSIAYLQEIEKKYLIYKRKVSGFGGPWKKVGEKKKRIRRIKEDLGYDAKVVN